MARRKRLPEAPFSISLDTLEESGRASGNHDGARLEVFDALPGEQVMARYLFGRRFRGQAATMEVLVASDQRVEPECPHFGTCSACSLQHVRPSAQIAFKQDWLLRHFAAQDGLAPERWLTPLQCDLWQYRRKARLSVRFVKAKGRVLVGFRERDGRFVADLDVCPVLPPPIGGRLRDLGEVIAGLDSAQTTPQIEVSCGDEDCALILRHLEPLSESDRARLCGFSEATGLAIYLQGGGPDSVEPLTPPAKDLVYRLPQFGLEYRFGPLDFVQVNASMNSRMIGQAIDLLQLEAGDDVLELFCGLGNFSLPLAQNCASVTGFEGDAALVERALGNARRNGVGNARFVQADLYQEPVTLPGGHFDKALIDPPRSGAGPVLPALADSGARRLVYVSCNPKTLAEDASVLVRQHGFRLEAAGVMDMFPHTTHLESMALFTR